MKYLIVVDMQNDFIDGALGTPEAEAIVPAVEAKIRAFDGHIIFTQDTHFENYLSTQEGRKLPVEHCIKDTQGWQIREELLRAAEGKDYEVVEKYTFGSSLLPDIITGDIYRNGPFIPRLIPPVKIFTNCLPNKTIQVKNESGFF